MFKLKNKLMMGGGGGGMGGGCFFYNRRRVNPAIVNNPDVTFYREVYMMGNTTMDDGANIRIWGFKDNSGGGGGGGMGGGGGGMSGGGGGPFPSPTMRLNEGQFAHTNLTVGGMLIHTIHHHGIEPDYRSDGVGHTSFDIQGNYTYQWRPSQAGTYFYHCHTNTVLHVEMGMYGALIVDPPSGPGSIATAGGGTRPYDVEAIWVVDEIDPAWHNIGANQGYTAGTCGGDLGFHDLNPKYFVITGVDGNRSASTIASKIPAQMNVGQTLLIRYINAGYYPQRLRLDSRLQGQAEVVASDARPIPNPIPMTQWDTVAAERYDIMVKPTKAGTYTVEFDILHWITGNVLGTARTIIEVA